MSDKQLKSYIQFDSGNAEERKAVLAKLDKVQFTPLEGQVAFIKELVKFPEEASKFLENPKEYSVEHGVLIDPAIVQKVSEQVLYDVALDEEFANTVGPHITKDIVDLRNRLKFGPGTIEPKPIDVDPTTPLGPLGPYDPRVATVIAAAAVVVAAAAVVEAVVTVVRTKKTADLVSLQGLGENGTVLPRGEVFQDRTGIRGGAVLPNVVRGGFRVR